MRYQNNNLTGGNTCINRYEFKESYVNYCHINGLTYREDAG